MHCLRDIRACIREAGATTAFPKDSWYFSETSDVHKWYLVIISSHRGAKNSHTVLSHRDYNTFCFCFRWRHFRAGEPYNWLHRSNTSVSTAVMASTCLFTDDVSTAFVIGWRSTWTNTSWDLQLNITNQCHHLTSQTVRSPKGVFIVTGFFSLFLVHYLWNRSVTINCLCLLQSALQQTLTTVHHYKRLWLELCLNLCTIQISYNNNNNNNNNNIIF